LGAGFPIDEMSQWLTALIGHVKLPALHRSPVRGHASDLLEARFWITSFHPTIRELRDLINTSAFGRSRPAADATREVVERWLLYGL